MNRNLDSVVGSSTTYNHVALYIHSRKLGYTQSAHKIHTQAQKSTERITHVKRRMMEYIRQTYKKP